MIHLSYFSLKFGDLDQVWENNFILTSLSGDGLLVRDCINILDSFSGDVLLVRDCINSIINWCLDNKLVFMIGLLGLIDNLSFGGRRLIGEMVF